MADELLEYYEQELIFLRRTGADFAKRYPKVAARLQLEATKCDDPHVERLLEGFAFLAARVHRKIDDDFPEITEALLEVVYPHYVRPLPSMSLVEFELDREQGKLTKGLAIPRGTRLYSRSSGGVSCQFRTCYDTTVWPLSVTSVKWISPNELSPPVRSGDAVAALRIELACLPDVRFAQLELDRLRLHIRAEPNPAATLYELLCNNTREVLVRELGAKRPREPVALPADALVPVGFGPDEGMLPFVRRSFVGYRLLQEYFAFPQKYLFLDVTGLERLREAGFGERIEVIFLISPFERAERREMLHSAVTRDTIRLACTPIVNLFPQTSEPLLLNQRRHEYLIIPDARRRATTGIFSVDSVSAVHSGADEVIRFEPFYSFRHGSPADGRQFWLARRRPTGWRMDEETDVYLSFVDTAGRVTHPELTSATARLTCHNGTLPSRLPFGDPGGDFELEGGGPIRKVSALINPTAPVQPPLGRSQLWHLISLLSLNYVSIAEGGADALRELLRLHDFGGSASTDRQLQGIVRVEARPCYSRIESENGLGFARGHRVEIEFDEEQYAGGVYLLASVLERFLGLHVSLNSFSILNARTRQRKDPLREWAPRAGWKALL